MGESLELYIYPPGNDLVIPLPFGTFESMIFLFQRWDMLVPVSCKVAF